MENKTRTPVSYIKSCLRFTRKELLCRVGDYPRGDSPALHDRYHLLHTYARMSPTNDRMTRIISNIESAFSILENFSRAILKIRCHCYATTRLRMLDVYSFTF